MTWSTILAWCSSHWDLLATIFANLVVLFVVLLKKKIKISDVFTTVLSVMPDWIRVAEASGESGEKKFNIVFFKAIDLLVSLTHKSQSELINLYGVAIRDNIENILNTPQKKGR